MNNRLFVSKLSEAAGRYPDATFSRRSQFYTCVNPFSYHLIRKGNIPYTEIDGLYVDGILMQKLVNLLWGTNIRRLSFDMTGMAPDLFSRLQISGESVFFIGARQEQVAASVDTILNAYPGINLAGFRHGYFDSKEDRDREIRKIVDAHPDFVIIGMGAPLQEHFLVDLKKAGFKGIAFTCGGFLHQTANRINYYPDWVNRYNLRAFYRLFNEKNLFKRLYNVIIQFPVLFTIDTIRTRLGRK